MNGSELSLQHQSKLGRFSWQFLRCLSRCLMRSSKSLWRYDEALFTLCRLAVVQALQKAGTHLGWTRWEVQGQPRCHHRQDGLYWKRAAGRHNPGLSVDQVLSKGQRPGPSMVSYLWCQLTNAFYYYLFFIYLFGTFIIIGRTYN